MFMRKKYSFRLKPKFIYYSPLLIWLFWLILKYRIGLRSLLSLNPSMRFAGTGLDSKYFRLSKIDSPRHKIPTLLMQINDVLNKSTFTAATEKADISFPMIIKPNRGNGSIGVKKVNNFNEVEKAFSSFQPKHLEFLIQSQILYKYEFSLNYYRFPGDTKGKIFDLAERKLPIVIGDGKSSVIQLINFNDELINNINMFPISEMMSVDFIPSKNEEVELHYAANNMFANSVIDWTDKVTPELQETLDDISNRSDLHILKFDVKTKSPREMLSFGKFKILEINGLTAQINSAYAASYSYFESLKRIAAHYEILFRLAKKIRIPKKFSNTNLIRETYKYLFANRRARSL